ncbi:MAG: bifunctional histidinol-phosphatase/imidazoleglycerol-phosphate dehydratase [Chromatiales bacterium]|jgi:imidazoleglycerol-phosphate dehydratase/histidinol-phosphatase|nr:bifunctional histidinol-phosphatase/imidazoleglycerol-phosphate dehydratase [Chromatiales bacterium]MDP6149918.1 bifunctional histidinol-phosphatase/imidazoleglycerol-phosphate dehydratase HisB [Gammaproteobacteria bacterium]MDP7269778.1 bifunctional histidinol-phosphatase/imidazoleglycerol-phosphate dehydratase HisB [Gammaproteobacteria bacterium]HJP04651.1 bifunctional histidinol-phosphatase/imidazoleglycerol-phosphate dehydratase HisB [Gammaproteobacteria bacterium]
MSTPIRVAFVDRDGTLIKEPDDNQVDRIDKIELVPGVIPALSRLRDTGFRFVMISNQDGRGTDSFPEEDFRIPQDFTLALFASQGIEFDEIFVCPHFAADGCECRKPLPGLLGDYFDRIDVDRANSLVAGDRETDLSFARNINVPGYLVDPEDAGSWPSIVRQVLDAPRVANVERKTKETDINVTVDLDAAGPVDIDTGIGFYDHMLDQIARHGGFSLRLSCKGDLEVDEHHTVEDVALALGQAIREALGDKRGIGRFGFVVPMDETQAKIAIDLGGRPYLVFDGEFPRTEVGGLPTELVPHFFRSFGDTLGASIQLSVSGENTHHMVEACFKSTGRALRDALRREGSELPSTKGTL